MERAADRSNAVRKFTDFEVVTRTMRWLVIASIVLMFPYDVPQAKILYVLAVAAAVFNLTRYSSSLLKTTWFASPIFTLAVDNLFIAALIMLVGGVDNPFSAFAIFPIVYASYLFRFRGTLGVVLFQFAWLGLVLTEGWFDHLVLDRVRVTILLALVLTEVGYFVERLTRVERAEKEQFEQISRDIEAERKHLLALLDGLTDAIYVVDRQGKVIDCNAVAGDLSSGAKDLHGKQFNQVLHLYARTDADRKPVNLLKDAGPQHRRDLRLVDRTGGVMDLDISVQPVQIEGKRTTDYVIVCRDITKERSLDEERHEFISVASHELRTPIAIMEGSLTMINSLQKLNPQAQKFLDQAHDNCVLLGSIVKDLSLLGAASNDNLPVELEMINPGELLQGIADSFKAQLYEKGLTVKVEVSEDAPEVLSTKNYVLEILQNYMTNTLKYTKEGQVTLRAVASPKHRGNVVFSVEDQGIGISLSDQKHLFTKFFRAEDYRTRETVGTGLGLYLCMEIAQRLNGDVWCESELNKGSTFFLEVPSVGNLKRPRGRGVKAEAMSVAAGV